MSSVVISRKYVVNSLGMVTMKYRKRAYCVLVRWLWIMVIVNERLRSNKDGFF